MGQTGLDVKRHWILIWRYDEPECRISVEEVSNRAIIHCRVFCKWTKTVYMQFVIIWDAICDHLRKAGYDKVYAPVDDTNMMFAATFGFVETDQYIEYEKAKFQLFEYELR